jgi:dihydrofolate synthase/folylpolyglutamate synthase
VPIAGQQNSIAPQAIVDIAHAAGIPATALNSVEAALMAVGGLDLDPPPRILITGSLYLAGHVLAANGTLPE